MSEEYTVYLIVGGVILIAALIGLALIYEKKRTEKLRQLAIKMGYQFEDKSPLEAIGDTGGFELFSRGRMRKIRNRMFGDKDNVESMVFGYRYTVGSGRNSHTYNQTVALFKLKGDPLPVFSLSPENVFHRIGEVFGRQDIDFEEFPRFSKQYVLRGPDEQRIRETFNREILGFFEQHPGWNVESDGGGLVVYRAKKRVKPDQMEMFYTDAKRVYDQFA